MSSYAKMEAPLSPSMLTPKLPPSQDPRSRVRRRVPPPKQPQELTQLTGPKGRVLAPPSDASMSQSQSQSQPQSQRLRDSYKPGSSPMRGINTEDMNLLQQEAKVASQQGKTRQMGRKSSAGVMATNKRHEKKSDGKSNLGAKSTDSTIMSDDDRETNQRLFGETKDVGKSTSAAGVEKLRIDGEVLPPSNMGDIDIACAIPNGFQPVSNSKSAISHKETLDQHHDPGRWSKPSFMDKTGAGPKLGGFVAELGGVEAEAVGDEKFAWLSWRKLGEILLVAST
ncbi:hypothetical protein AN958_03900 [Leucoagaricus sp. SymC.cos]|nr:hypothetical protein AN958_03900 [Leucoagaricus sp. SymC.cos]